MKKQLKSAKRKVTDLPFEEVMKEVLSVDKKQVDREIKKIKKKKQV